MHDHTDYGSKECQDSCLKHGTMNLKDLKNLSLPFLKNILLFFLSTNWKIQVLFSQWLFKKKKRKAWWTVTMTPLRILVGINSEYQKSCQWHLVYFCKCECCTLYAVWVSVRRDLAHCSTHNRYLIELLSTQRTQYTSQKYCTQDTQNDDLK